MMADKKEIYRSIARFFDKEINSHVYSSEINEGLEGKHTYTKFAVGKSLLFVYLP